MIITEEQLDKITSRDMRNPDEIFNYIRSMPKKYRLLVRWVGIDKQYGDGISTAINTSPITNFYLEYLKKRKKTATVMYGPELNPELYDKLNGIITMCDKHHIPPGEHVPFSMSSAESNSLDNRLLKQLCFQLMSMLLYEDYFKIDFRRGNVHDMVARLPVEDSPLGLKKLYKIIANKDGEIGLSMFFGVNNELLRVIEDR